MIPGDFFFLLIENSCVWKDRVLRPMRSVGESLTALVPMEEEIQGTSVDRI